MQLIYFPPYHSRPKLLLCTDTVTVAMLNELLLYQVNIQSYINAKLCRAMIGPSRTESRVNGTLGSRNVIQRTTWTVKICHFVEARSLYNTVYE